MNFLKRYPVSFKTAFYFSLILIIPILYFIGVTDLTYNYGIFYPFTNAILSLLIILLGIFITFFLPTFLASMIAEKNIKKSRKPWFIFFYLPVLTFIFSGIIGIAVIFTILLFFDELFSGEMGATGVYFLEIFIVGLNTIIGLITTVILFFRNRKLIR